MKAIRPATSGHQAPGEVIDDDHLAILDDVMLVLLVDDVRLERFRADEIPLNTSRALSTFADVAARDDSVDSVLTGIDIRV